MSAWALREHNEDGTHNVRPSGFDFVPIGSMLMWPTNSAPSGWLLCDGSQVSRTTYVTLFSLLGTTYGAGDGTTTFNLPDLRQRFPLGKAASGTGSTLGSTGGSIDHTHTGGAVTGSTGSTAPGTDTQGAHSHGSSTGNESSHTHSITVPDQNTGTSSGVSTPGIAGIATTSPNVSHVHDVPSQTFTSDAGSSHAHSISSDGSHSHTVNAHTHAAGTLAAGTTGTANPPFLVINFIISAGV
jgi:microcystin-dependent protein